MLLITPLKPDESTEIINQNKQSEQTTDLQIDQELITQSNSVFNDENICSLRKNNVIENHSFSSLQKLQMSQVSADTLRLLGIFDTKPIVSCERNQKETECNNKLNYNNFKIKNSTLLNYVCSKKSIAAFFRQSKMLSSNASDVPANKNDGNRENRIEEKADSRMIKMYFSHLDDKATDSSASSSESSSTSSSRASSPSPSSSSSKSSCSEEEQFDEIDEAISNGEGSNEEASSTGDNSVASSSTYSQSTISRNEENNASVNTNADSNNETTTNCPPKISIAPGILPPGRPIDHHHHHHHHKHKHSHHHGKSTCSNGLKKKRNQRQFYEYFHAHKHGVAMYNLIRHTFSGPKEHQYLKLPRTRQILKALFESSRNCIRRITPETEQVEMGKVLLISQHLIKQAKQMDDSSQTQPKSKKHSKTFKKYLHRSGFYNIRNRAPLLAGLFVRTEDGPYARVICGETESQNETELSSSRLKHLQTITEFDHMYISDVTTATMDHFVASINDSHATKDTVNSQKLESGDSTPKCKLSQKENQETHIETEIITNTKFIEDAITVASPTQLMRRKNLNFLMLGANAFTAEQVARTKVIEKGEEKLSPSKRIVKLLKENPYDWCMPVVKMCRSAVVTGQCDPPPAKPKLSMSRRLLDRGMADLSQRLRIMNVVAEYGENLLQFDFASKPDDERLSHLIQFCMKVSKTKDVCFPFAVYMVAESYLMTFTHGQLLEGVEKYKKLLDAYDMRRSVCI